MHSLSQFHIVYNAAISYALNAQCTHVERGALCALQAAGRGKIGKIEGLIHGRRGYKEGTQSPHNAHISYGLNAQCTN